MLVNLLTPQGYDEDLANCTVSKVSMKQVMQKVYTDSGKWRYDLNLKKRAIQVLGDTRKELKIGSEYRKFSLGRRRVREYYTLTTQ